MTDTEAGGELSTDYMGLRLRNPLVASPSPLSYTLEGVRRLAEGGAAAIVLFSLFEEQVHADALRATRLFDATNEISPEARGYFPAAVARDEGPRRYLQLIERAAAAVDVPVIASLNGVTPGGWLRYARAMQNAGAAAIELNLYYLPEDPFIPGLEVERTYVEIVGRVRDSVTIPVAVKLGPQISSVGALAQQLTGVGANGLVLFNRFLAPDIEPEQLEVIANTSLSRAEEGRPARAWIAMLHGRVALSLAASTGVESAQDVAAHLLAGADVVMTTSALLRHGPDYSEALLAGLRAWMARKGFKTIDACRGLLSDSRNPDEGARHRRDGYARSIRSANAGTYSDWSRQ